jgi:hypothetical protein
MTTSSSAAVPTDDQLDRLRQILDQPAFLSNVWRSGLDVLLAPINELLDKVGQEIGRLLRQVQNEPGLVDPTIWVSLLLAGVLVLVAAWMAFRAAGITLTGESVLRAERPGGPPSAEALRAEAVDLARRGELRAALHLEYLALLRRLDERDLLPYDPSATNQELLPRVRNPAVARPLAALVQLFDRLWYGQSTCSTEELAQLAALAERAWQAAG